MSVVGGNLRRHPHQRGRLFTKRRTALSVMFVAALAAAATVMAIGPNANAQLGFEVQSLDGSGNNVANPTWGKVGTIYPRLAPARYADGHSAPVAGPNARTVSNRIFQDYDQNIFTVSNASWNAVIPGNGGSLTDVGFTGAWDNTTDPSPANFLLNGRRCAR